MMLKGIVLVLALVSVENVLGQGSQVCAQDCPARSNRDTNSCECRCQTTNQAPVNGHCPCGYVPTCPAGATYNFEQCQCLCSDGQQPVNNVCQCQEVCPARSQRDTNSCGCRCYETNQAPVDGQCPCGFVRSCTGGSSFNSKTCQCECSPGRPLVNGTCQCQGQCPARSNRDLNSCECLCHETNSVPVNGHCPCGSTKTCPAGATYNFEQCQCVCSNGQQPVNNVCQCQEVCPPRSQRDTNSCDCLCYETNQAAVDGHCPCGFVMPCTEGTTFNPKTCQCECGSGKVLNNGACVCQEECPPRSSRDTNSCDCVCDVTNHAPRYGLCPCGLIMPCTGGATFNPKTCQCQCSNGLPLVNGTCECQDVCPPRSNRARNSCECLCHSTNQPPSTNGGCPCGFIMPCHGEAIFNPRTCKCECSVGKALVNGVCERLVLWSASTQDDNDNDSAGFLQASVVMIGITVLSSVWLRG